MTDTQRHVRSTRRLRASSAAVTLVSLAFLVVPGAAETRYVNAAAPPGGNGLIWPTAFNSLRDALAVAAASGGVVDQIWVAAGVYTPDGGTLNRVLAFDLVSGVAVYGGFAGGEGSLHLRDPNANPTILSGDLLGNDGPSFTNMADNSYHVVRAVGVDAAAVLDGFVIRGGNASDLGGDNSTGGGIWIRNGAATVRLCAFRQNRATFGGAAHLHTSSARFDDCMFESNLGATAAGGIFAQPSGHIELVRCTLAANSAGLQGGAIALSQSSSLMAVNARFFGNVATGFGGGAILNSSSLITLANGLFSGNSTGSTVNGGGAIRNERGTSVLTNCTFVGNSSPAGGGAVFNFMQCDVTIENSILWGNAGSGSVETSQIVPGAALLTITHSIVQGWTGVLGGLAVFDANPLFVDADGPDNVVGTPDDDLRIGDCASQALNAGDDAAVPVDVLDVDGDSDSAERLPLDLLLNPRRVDGRVDAGALEFAAPSCACGDLDRDGVLTVGDLNLFGSCLGGPDLPWPLAGCAWPAFVAGDCDRDGDVDLVDFAKFQAAY